MILTTYLVQFMTDKRNEFSHKERLYCRHYLEESVKVPGDTK